MTDTRFDLNSVRDAVRSGRIRWQVHALARMMERGIMRNEVVAAINDGEVIEVYPSDKPFPSALLLFEGENPIHVVCSVDESERVAHIITAYRPDLEHFQDDYKTRRQS